MLSDFFVTVPHWLLTAFVVALGLVIGSFLNVVVARLPHGQSLVRPRSACPQCQSPIRARDNIPVLSYLWLRGRCHHCAARISVRYPVIELLTALLFLAAYQRFGFSALLLIRDFPFLAILVAVTFIDLEHRIIPDYLSLGGLGLGLLTAFWVPGLGLLSAFSGAAFGFGAFYLLSWAYYKYAGRVGLGGGDVKLLAMLGAFLGPAGVFGTILVSSISGSVIGIGWALAQQRRLKNGEPTADEPATSMLSVAIPYGPFLVLGGLYYYLLGDLVWFRSMIPT